MKFLVLILIASLVYGGFSAASHAMGTKDCSFVSVEKLEECQHHAASSDKDHAKKHQENGAGKCMDCVHCCAAAPALVQLHSFDFPSVNLSYSAVPMQFHLQERAFSLLRPPRNLA